MDGRARLRRQLQSGVRDHVKFIDSCRMRYGMDKVKSLTPKVETRLRSGDQARIPLQVQYICDEAKLALILTLNRDYPASPINVQVVPAKSPETEDGSNDDGDSDNEEVEECFDTVREQNILVLQQHLQHYCDSLVISEDEENDREVHEQIRKLSVGTETRSAPHSSGTPPDSISLTTYDAIVGVDVIDLFKTLAMRHPGDDLKLNAMGDVVPRVFQFADMAEKLNALSILPENSENDDLGELNGEIGYLQEKEQPLDSAPPATFKCARCRLLLFSSADLEPHDVPKPSRGKPMAPRSSVLCTSHFLVEGAAPPTHAEAEQRGLSAGLRRVADPGAAHAEDGGILVCSKCGSKTGAWSWVGLQCSCQAWVCPAFQVTASKVDKCE